jgi:cytochrome c oxidase subunit 5b
MTFASIFRASPFLFGIGRRFQFRMMGGKVSHENLPVGPGAPPGTMPTSFEQAVGLERLEYLAEAEGVSLYIDEELRIEKRGTLKEPVLVETIQGERIVGCTGFPKYSHNAVWMQLKGYDSAERCLDCGQAFKLVPAKMAAYKAT